ncbi:MAG: hypothetical protein COZ18_06885 [Flexibacter sp. CG_4_10_14_3_um_filter_32_15]|nr:MAG: hypothetical protein COZ18_06885 [Flexibacter sp. CG_4_10_14_3_um_filter_32_15]
MKLKFVFTSLFLLTSFFCYAQSVTLSGYVTDKENSENLIGATIYSLTSKRGIVTNNYGYYSLNLPTGEHILQISYIGYETKIDTIFIEANQTKNIELISSALLNAVEIHAKAENIEETQAGSISISSQTIKETPALFGQPDVLRTLQLLPGVKMGQEGSTGLHVRGGSPDQNLILLDGVPVYNTQHLFSFISVFNPEAVQKVDLMKSSIPAKYGGRLSSVLDIQLKEGNQKKKQGSFTFSPIASSFSYESPIKKKGSFLVAIRRTWLDFITTPVLAALSNAEENYGYNFHDISVKANWQFNQKDRIFLSLYTNRDKFGLSWRDDGDVVKFNFKWGNEMAILRWNRVISPKVFSNLSTFYSNYHYDRVGSFKTSDEYFEQKSTSKIREIAIKSDWEAYIHHKHLLTFGAKASALRFAPEIVELTAPTSDTVYRPDPANDALLFAAYIQNDWKISRLFEFQKGVRATYYLPKGKGFFQFEPRLSFKFKPTKRVSAHISYNYMMQYINLLTNSSIGLPTDLWVSSSSSIVPQRSWQVSTGINKNVEIAKSNFEFSLEGYYKKFYNLTEFKEGSSFLYSRGASWEDKIAQGDGEAYGTEFFIRKQSGKLQGWVAYTLAWSNRTIAEINEGKTFPYKYDRRHDLSIWVKWFLSNKNKKKFISTNWVYSTGNAITLPIGSYSSPAPANWTDYKNNLFNERPQLGSRNDFRLNSYHRLDVSYQTSKTTKKNRERTWIISVYNTYNQLNPYFFYYSKGNLKQITLFPIIPSVAYRLDF